MDKVKIGIIGLGQISKLHLPVYKSKNNINAEIVAICDKNKKKLKEVSEEYNVEHVYTNADEFFKDNIMDAVEILTPHHLHTEHTIKALKAGKHVSLQKVPALSLSDMDKMIELSKQTKLKFRVFENFRFYEPYIKAKNLIKQNVIGKPVKIDYQMLSAEKSLSAWDVPLKTWQWRITEKENYKLPTIFDDGYHKHSIIAHFFKEKVKSVIAWQGKTKVMGVLDWDLPANIIYTFKNKAHYATWSISMHKFFPLHSKYYGCDEYLSIFGEKGAIYVPGCTGSLYENCDTSAPGKAGVHWIDEEGKWHSDLSVNTDWANSFVNCSREFIDAIREDRQPEVNPIEARYILQISLAIIRSLRSKYQEIQVKDIKDIP
ncbi:MAG: Gfo/Idh/MocA family protein [Promethearchaeota archaeon]